MASTNMDR